MTNVIPCVLSEAMSISDVTKVSWLEVQPYMKQKQPQKRNPVEEKLKIILDCTWIYKRVWIT